MLVRYARALWGMGRPLFLVGISPLYLLGVASAWHDAGRIERPWLLLAGLLEVWLVQLMTHYSNEYWDLETDLATRRPTRISGGSRVLVRGTVPRAAARLAAVVCLGLAIAFGIILMGVLGGGVLIVAFVGLAMFVGWYYSTPPLKLKAWGVGELAIVLVTAFLLPSFAYYLETSTLSLGLLQRAVPLGLLTFSLTLATELPDREADRATGQMTLVARLGARKAVLVQGAFFAVGWLYVGLGLVDWRPYWGWAAVAASLPLLGVGLAAARPSCRGDVAAMERLGLTSSLMLGYATLALSARYVFE